MTISLLTHPLVTFVAGTAVAVGILGVFLSSCAAPNRSAADVAAYKADVARAAEGPVDEKAAVARFTAFLQGIGDAAYVKENTRRVYAEDAVLDDTLVKHKGAAEIEAYFLKTSGTLKSYQVTIDDLAKSGDNHYVRWTMVLSAPALAGGETVHSVGISQVRFDRDGKIILHQDFWDSGRNFYGHLPVAGGIIGFIRKKLESP